MRSCADLLFELLPERYRDAELLSERTSNCIGTKRK
jgi:hypothetical protein